MIRPLAFGQRTLFTNILAAQNARKSLQAQGIPNYRVTWQNPQSNDYHFAVLTNQGTNHLACFQQAQDQLLQDETLDNTTWMRQSNQLDADFATLPDTQLAQKYNITDTSPPLKRAQSGL